MLLSDAELVCVCVQMVIDPATGEIKNLGFDPETAMGGKLRQIYDLYDDEEAMKAYKDVQEPYRMRPSTWRTRRMYNRQPIGLKSDTSDVRLKAIFDRLESEVEARKKTEDALSEAMKQLQEIKAMMKK